MYFIILEIQKLLVNRYSFITSNSPTYQLLPMQYTEWLIDTCSFLKLYNTHASTHSSIKAAFLARIAQHPQPLHHTYISIQLFSVYLTSTVLLCFQDWRSHTAEHQKTCIFLNCPPSQGLANSQLSSEPTSAQKSNESVQIYLFCFVHRSNRTTGTIQTCTEFYLQLKYQNWFSLLPKTALKPLRPPNCKNWAAHQTSDAPKLLTLTSLCGTKDPIPWAIDFFFLIYFRCTVIYLHHLNWRKQRILVRSIPSTLKIS